MKGKSQYRQAVEALYPWTDTTELARKLKRTPAQLADYACRIGVHKAPEFYSSRGDWRGSNRLAKLKEKL